MKNAAEKWGLMYTSVQEKLGLKTIKMADGLVNKYNKGKRYLVLTFFFLLIFNFSYCDSHGSHPGSHDSHGSHYDSHGSLARTLVRLVAAGLHLLLLACVNQTSD